MPKRAQRKIASLLLIVQLFFSLLAPFSPFINQVIAQDQTSSANFSEFSTDSLGFSQDGDMLLVNSNQNELDYSYYYLYNEVVQNARGRLSTGANALMVGTQSGSDFIYHQFDDMVFKAQRGDVTYSYYLQKQDGELTVSQILVSDSLELTAEEQDRLEQGAADDWNVDEETRTAVTAENVELNVEYVFPLNDKVSVTFTRLPAETSALTIREVVLSEELAEKYGTDTAYDITTEMEDGSFEFDLSLPKPDSVEADKAEVVYAETEDELADDARVQSVETERDGEKLVEVDEEAGVVKAKKVEHMTVFVVSTSLLDGSTTPTCVQAGATEQTGCFTTIQAAIDAAGDGNTVKVLPGTYEENVIVNVKGLTIQGPNNTLNGNDTSRTAEAIIEGVVRVEADDVTIEGFFIDGTNVDQASNLTKRGILVANTNARSKVIIQNNIIKNWTTGVSLAGGPTSGWVDGATIEGNLFINNGIGSTENVKDLTIKNNTFDNGGFGLGGGAVLASVPTGNTFSNVIDGRYISVASDVDADFSEMLSLNTFDKAVYANQVTGEWYEKAIFSAIKPAINVAATDSTVEVSSGTYVEDGQIVVDKNLTIVGEDKETTIIKPSQNTGSEGNARGWFLVESDIEFNLSNVTLDGDGKQVHQAIRSFGSGTVENNIIKNIRYSQYYGLGIVVMGDENMTVKNNHFSNIGRIGMMAFGDGVMNAVFDGNTYIGKGSGDYLDYGIEVGGGASATIKGNNISNCGSSTTDWGSAAILVTDTYGPGTKASIKENYLHNNETGIVLGYGDEDSSKILILEDNKFENNTYHIDVDSGVINLEGALSENTFDRTVVVRENAIKVPTIFSSIQDAIDAAESGDTVEVSAGTYEENIKIDKGLSLLGESKENTIISPNAGRVIDVLAQSYDINSLTIQGFTLQPNDASIALQSNSSLNNEFDGANYLYKDLIIDQNDQENSAIGLFDVDTVTLDNVLVQNSTRSEAGAIEIIGVKNLLIKNSKIKNNPIGIKISSVAGYEKNENFAINHSEITNNSNYGILNEDSDLLIDATDNWWGANSGPKDTWEDESQPPKNEGGEGNAVRGAVKYGGWDRQVPEIYTKQHSYCTDINKIPQLVETKSVSSSDLNGETFTNLDPGSDYQLTVTGEFSYSNNSSQLADAAYTTTDSWSNFSGEYGSYGNKAGVLSLLSDLGRQTGVSIIDWGSYNDNHQYSFVEQNLETDSIQFVVSDWFDSWYGSNWDNQGGMKDNSGELEVSVYKCIEDTEAPIAQIEHPSDGAYIKGVVDLTGNIIEENMWRYFYRVREVATNTNVTSATVYGTLENDIFYEWDTTQSDDGEYWIHLAANDLAENRDESVSVDNIYVTVDNTSPVVELHKPLTSYVSGEVIINASASDSNLNYYRVIIHNDDGERVADTSKQYVSTDSFKGDMLSWDSSEEPDGDYRIYLIVEDLATNRTTVTRDITVDNTRPNITFEQPEDGAILGGNILLKATCNELCDYINFWWWSSEQTIHDAVDNQQNHRIKLNDTEFEWTLNSLNPLHWNGEIGDALNGFYTLRAAGKDLVGNYNHDEISVTIDNTAPEISITPSRQPDIGKWYSTRPSYSNTHPTIELTSNEEAVIQYKWDGASDWETYSGEINTSVLPNGEHTLYVKATDLANNPNTNELTIWLDFSNPEGEMSIEETNGFVSEDMTINFSNVYDPSGSEGISRIEIWIGGHGYQGSAKNLSGGNYRFIFDTTTLVDGVYTARPSIFDKAGNRTRPSAQFTVDNAPPLTEISSPEEGDYFNSPISITGTTTDNNGVSFVTLSAATYVNEACGEFSVIDTGNELVSNPAATTFNWSFDWTPDSEGAYCIKAQGTDVAGNPETTAVVQNVVYDITIPQIDVTIDPENADGSGGWYTSRPTLTLTANDNFEVDVIQYQWNSDSDSGWESHEGAQINLDVPSEGTNRLYYRAIDKAQNPSEIDETSDTGVYTVRWDATDLTDGPLNVSVSPNPTGGSTAAVSWDKADDNIGINKYSITWELRDGDDKHSKEVNGDVTETTISDLLEGTYKITVRAYDNSGHNKSDSTDLTVDRTAPAAPTLTLGGTRDGEVDLSWTEVEDADDYIILYGLEPGNHIYAARVGDVTGYTVQGLTAGSYYFVVRAVDEVDNQSPNSNEVSSGTILGAVGLGEGVGGPAVGFGEAGEVLGEETEAAEQEPEEQEEQASTAEEEAGEVLGAATDAGFFRSKLPWIMLGLQALALVIFELIQRRQQSMLKFAISLGITLLLTALYLLLRNPEYFAEGSATMLLNNWYWLAAIGIMILVRMIGYGFIEEVEL